MKFFETALSLKFERCEGEHLEFLKDFNRLNKNAVLTRFKQAAAKVNFSEGEELLFKLFLSLKEDIMRMDDKISQKNSPLVLKNEAMICGVGFEGIKFSTPCLENGALYYAKTEINREIMGFFFVAQNESEGEITRIKKEDKSLFDAFVVETQRQNILKGKQ